MPSPWSGWTTHLSICVRRRSSSLTTRTGIENDLYAAKHYWNCGNSWPEEFRSEKGPTIEWWMQWRLISRWDVFSNKLLAPWPRGEVGGCAPSSDWNRLPGSISAVWKIIGRVWKWLMHCSCNSLSVISTGHGAIRDKIARWMISYRIQSHEASWCCYARYNRRKGEFGSWSGFGEIGYQSPKNYPTNGLFSTGPRSDKR